MEIKGTRFCYIANVLVAQNYIHHYIGQPQSLKLTNLTLTDYLKPEYIEIGLKADSKEELLDGMFALAEKSPHVLDPKKMRSSVLEREKIMSTGVGKNFAIPHGKTDAVDDIVLAFATTAEPVDYASMDNEPVRLVLLLVSKESLVGQRLKLLSRASKVMNSDAARTALLNAKSAEEALAIFHTEEDKIGE
ncbi:MAG TPA: PTS sugar transporter subunit IIA [Candidatus Kapabacteria bacterium]|jgi:mannitol/fructose-specific phosphotransferase system IIA component (Ntr-type)|nr:PTS sugar transporter subunit IIA [Candidatus Kapabacteria bacterium]